METTIIGKHDVLCSSLNFATPEGAAECDCNLSIMADMLEALEKLAEQVRATFSHPATTSNFPEKLRLQVIRAEAAIAKARSGGAV